MMPVIEFQKIAKAFGDNPVLDGVDLSIVQGETITIIGGSGQGKTVFLKLILGLLLPDRGHVLFKGQDLSEMYERELIRMRSRIGMLFQGAALFDSLTVRENIAYPLREHFRYAEEEIDRIVAREAGARGPRRDRGDDAGRPLGRHEEARGAGARDRHRPRRAALRRADHGAGSGEHQAHLPT